MSFWQVFCQIAGRRAGHTPPQPVLAREIRYCGGWAPGRRFVSTSDDNTLTPDSSRRDELEREREAAQAELDSYRVDHTGSQQFAVPKIKALIQRIHEIDKELEQIELAIELERQMDS
jgi:hypothetical protein